MTLEFIFHILGKVAFAPFGSEIPLWGFTPREQGPWQMPLGEGAGRFRPMVNEVRQRWWLSSGIHCFTFSLIVLSGHKQIHNSASPGASLVTRPGLPILLREGLVLEPHCLANWWYTRELETNPQWECHLGAFTAGTKRKNPSPTFYSLETMNVGCTKGHSYGVEK